MDLDGFRKPRPMYTNSMIPEVRPTPKSPKGSSVCDHVGLEINDRLRAGWLNGGTTHSWDLSGRGTT